MPAPWATPLACSGLEHPRVPPVSPFAPSKRSQEPAMSDVETQEFAPAADGAAQAERDIQAPLDTKERRSLQEKDEEKEKPAMQAGARPYPAPPFPEQHQVKPGLEARLDP